MHSSNICSVYVPKESKINRRITEHSSVRSSAPGQTDMVHWSYNFIERIKNLNVCLIAQLLFVVTDG